MTEKVQLGEGGSVESLDSVSVWRNSGDLMIRWEILPHDWL